MESTIDDDVEIIDDTIADPETTCAVCSAEFIDAEDLKIHVQQVHPARQSQPAGTLKPCPFCDSCFPDSEVLCFHLRDHHLDCLKSCKHCSKVFTNSQRLWDHEKKHTSKKNKISCSQCDELFNNNAELEKHEYQNHANNLDGVVLKDEVPLLSSILNMSFTAFINCTISRNAFSCVQCEYSTYDVDAYISHLRAENCRSVTCNMCGHVYKNRKSLHSHLSKNNTCPRDVEKCTECYKYVKVESYSRHVKSCKSKKPNDLIKCSICSLTFELISELSDHQSQEHPLSIEVKHCKLCSRECVGTIALRKHLERTHKEDFHLYKYMCKECQDVFKHPQKLFAHFFMKHKDLEPYTCKICDKKFRIRKKFTLHIKLIHNSIGFVEFDENYNVFFTEKKSEKPFIPKSLIYSVSLGIDLPTLKTLMNKQKYDKKELKAKDIEDNENSKTLTVRKLRTLAKKKKEENPENQVLTEATSEAPTDTEGNQTEIETKQKKHKKKPKNVDTENKEYEDLVVLESSDDDNEPLLVLKRKHKKKRQSKDSKNSFTCKMCDKNCYTYQNYHNHLSLHSKSEMKTCVKCSREFKSVEKLEDHMQNEHSKSQLTDYLKNLIEKRKMMEQTDRELTTSEKFQRTIKKVKLDYFSGGARLDPVNKDVSVRNFLESFTPEERNASEIILEHSVTIKAINTPFYRLPVIKMSKYEPKEEFTNTQLAMPVKCKLDDVKVNVTVKLVNAAPRNTALMESSEPEYEYDDEVTQDSIPEVAEEVMLENEDVPMPVRDKPAGPHKIVIENIPKDYKDISIAHLLPEAPYFKIVKMHDMLNPDTKKDQKKEEEIELPNGTKLVTVNPLAHLLGGTPVEEVLQPVKNKYYKPRVTNVENVLKKALLELETGTKTKTRSARSKPRVTRKKK